MRHWLFKTEPSTFGIDDLVSRPQQTEPWNGVRNYQARNMSRDEIKKGDHVLFYHSSCSIPGIAGIAEVVKEAYPDSSAFDRQSPYYDRASTLENPRWYVVDIKLTEKFKVFLPLSNFKHHSKLKDMVILRRGNRLSITPVTTQEWQCILSMVKK